MLRTILILALPAACTLAASAQEGVAAPMRSPRNQVYQFQARGSSRTTAYLWIPETCAQLRGLLIFSQNVPEGLIAGHPAIRKVCAENALGIVYTSAGFFRGKMDGFGDVNLQQEADVKSLEAMLAELAAKSGYGEVATVPWLPIGESMSLLMVKGLVNGRPERCIAGIYACDIAFQAEKRVPILGLQGTASEWGQTKVDLRSNWRNTGNYQRVCDLRKATPTWPATLVVDPCGGHFTCSEQMLRYMAGYIGRMVKARLSDDGSPALKPLDVSQGCLAQLPLAGKGNPPIEAARGAADQARPWFIDRASAEEAQALAKVNWEAATQLPAVGAGEHCRVKPWVQNSVTQVEVRTAADFSLQPVLLDKIPEGWLGAGEALARSSNTPAVEWVSGSLAPLGENRFCVELDRNYKRSTLCLEVVVEGTPQVRKSVQPLLVNLVENTGGTPQTIDFKPSGEVPSGTPSIPLVAKASSGLPVKFYVEAGPAIVEQNRLIFTPLPPKTKFPVEITVVAWQWGTCEPPLFSQAQARQTFSLVK